MIVYSNTKGNFISDVHNGLIADLIEKEFKKHHLPHNNNNEHRAWVNSMQFMSSVLRDEAIDDDCSLAIEYQVPLTSKRVDFIIAGKSCDDKNNVVIIELKQWEDSKITARPDVVYTYVGGANRYVCHPSYQAYSYAKIIENFNDSINKYDIHLIPCAYLHNYREANRSHIENKFYKDAIGAAPLFLQRDADKLTNFIKKYVRKKDGIDILFKIDNGKLKPSKSLQDSIVSMLKGNKEFYLIDEQKIVYELIKEKVYNSLENSKDFSNKYGKYTIIIKGGPGTGKSVIAIQLLADLLIKQFSACYVTKNAAPRNVYFKKLENNDYKKAYIKSLFLSSGSFINAKNNQFDCILCDEAHRLNAKSGLFQNQGENQIKEIIHASRVSVFFIDEDQQVSAKDIGTIDEIKHWAVIENSKLIYDHNCDLVSQFRCNGSDGYLSFLDNLLEIRETANYTFDFDYDLRLFSNPKAMMEELRKKNINNKARMLAGYCYEWKTKKETEKGLDNPDSFDIKIDDFKAKWNFANTDTWAIDSNSFDQVGCIHTCQGLEFDYVGVIIGKDLSFKNGHVVTDMKARASSDKSLVGIKKKVDWQKKADSIIRNTYKVLLSRGQKGCYIYCQDSNLLKHISEMTGINIE